MADWFTAREIAELALPGLPATKRHVNRMAIAEGWAARRSAAGDALARPRAGRDGGGGLEYHVALLPPAARTALAAQMAKIEPATLKPPRPPEATSAPGPATEGQTLRRDAGLAVLALAEEHYRANRSLGRKAADHDFSGRYNRREITIPDWLKAALPKVSARSLLRWRGNRDQGQWHSIRGRGRQVKAVIERLNDGAVAGYIQSLIANEPLLAVAQVRQLVVARFSGSFHENGKPMALPHERSIGRWVAGWKAENRLKLMAFHDPDRFKSHFRFSGSDAYTHIQQVNQLWEIDASPSDAMTTEGRRTVYCCVDVFSRRAMFHLSSSARTEATLALMRKAILAWGVPETVKTDNGTDFKSRAFLAAMASVGIRHDVCDAYSPEQKGIVERMIGTMQRGFMTLLPGFIGHNVTDRKQIEARRSFAQRLGESDDRIFAVQLTHNELQQRLDAWARDVYEHRVHSTLGMTPFVRAQSSPGTVKFIANVHALDMLLSPVAGGWRQVANRGIRIDGEWYFHGALNAGDRVFCRRDGMDLGRVLVFASDHGEFICEAINPRLAGIDPRAAVAAVRAERARIDADGRAEMRRLKKAVKPGDMINTLLDHAARETATVTAFPRPQEDHSSPGLAQAEAAMAARSEDVPAPRLTTPSSNIVALRETRQQRFRRALDLRARIDAGEEVSVEDARWLGGYEMDAEFKACAQMVADFGSEWLSLA